MNILWPLILSGASAFWYVFGRVQQTAADIAREEKRKKADAILDEIPEGDPELFKDMIVFKTINSVNGELTFVRCLHCSWMTNWNHVKPALKICGCDAHPVAHFHMTCSSCESRYVLRSRDDVEPEFPKAPEPPVKVTPSEDKNLCECGCAEATSCTLSTGAAAWRCNKCTKLRPKLVGGVTEAKTN